MAAQENIDSHLDEKNKKTAKNAPENVNNEKWEEKKLEVLLEAASIAIKRARYVFILINMAAVIIFTAQFNSLSPWLENVKTRLEHSKIEESIKEKKIEVINEILRKELEIMSVPLLGIKVSVFDLAIIGSLATLLLAVWFYYCVRRENIVVEEVVRLARKKGESRHKRAYLYHGIAHYFVYTTAVKKESPAGITPQATARIAIQFLFFVPVLIPWFIISADLISLIKAPVVADFSGCGYLWCNFTDREKIEVYIRMGIAFILSLLSLSQCWQAYNWDASTRDLVDNLRIEVEANKQP